MRKNQLLPLFFLYLLTAASITRAQKITQEKGLTTAVFNVPAGAVKVRLPKDIRSGDVISGTVIDEPQGKTEKQIERNRAELQTYSFGLDGQKFSLGKKTFQFTATSDWAMSQPLSLLDTKGVNLIQITIPSTPVNEQEPGSSQCNAPSHALAGSPFRIKGNFDGNASNTNCSLDNKPIEIIAESPRQCIVDFPVEAKGVKTLSVNETGQAPYSQTVSGVDLQVSTGKLNLKKGESTYIDIKVTGLQNLPDTALLTIVNVTPNVVTMTNGNTQVIHISPPAESADGTFFIHCPAASITTGNFTVSINLDLPENKTKEALSGKSRIGMLDPFSKTLWVVPEEEAAVLQKLGASKQMNGTYLINCKSISNRPMTMTVRLMVTTLPLLNKKNKKPKEGEEPGKKDKKDSLDGYGRPLEDDEYEYVLEVDPGFPLVGGEYSLSEREIAMNRRRDSLTRLRRDSLRRFSKTEFVDWYKDKTGTPYNIYRNAQCVKVMNAHTEISCGPNQNVEDRTDSLRYFEEWENHFGRGGNNNKAGQFIKLELFDRHNCVGGDDICLSKFVTVGLKYVYSDKECKKLVEVIKIIGLSCE